MRDNEPVPAARSERSSGVSFLSQQLNQLSASGSQPHEAERKLQDAEGAVVETLMRTLMVSFSNNSASLFL